ncbi:MAG: hypothetical protein HY657_12355 [Acidobacteria bacterium]|nr:hypothetical protein [Acidobacteriota bacterium]
MERHVRLLGILAALWGALALLVGVSMLLLAAGALAILEGPDRETLSFAAGLTAAAFASIGVFTLLWGAAHAWAASLLGRRLAAGRILMLALAVVDLLVLPFGTALGIYALWVLLTNEGRRLFEPRTPTGPGRL